MSNPVLVFDMDGVLVDVSESYRETIARTAEHFTGVKVSRQQIQEYKNQGGWNDDWRLTQHIIAASGVQVPLPEVVDHFQTLFRGNGSDGLMLREQWVARPGVLEKLNQQFQFALFTGRPREEALMTLGRFVPGMVFDPIVGMEDVENHKPAPDGLLQIPGAAFYVGDTVDDARTARAAKVPFIGIAAPSHPLYLDLVFLFQEERAYAIVDDINFLHEVFAS
ncbi:MAG TPA: HAD hydrolase-like protein [Bryobacteraceae bacterium]|jgi:HAD superfamily phosphatase